LENNAVIKVNGVSKKFCRSLKRSMWYGFRDILRDTAGLRPKSGRLRRKEFWAVDDVSFELKKGETLGLIGPNGAGKTTILKMLNGIVLPDKGSLRVKGRVGALIQIGAGFHPQLTGRENIYINGAILGMGKREIDKKFDAIVEFADIGDFLNTPVKFYSSGMFVRLGFAVAVHCEPEVLLVDEVLAVGDLGFQRKCYDKINQMQRNETTIVIVSHNPYQVERLCDRVLLLNDGKLKKLASAKDIITLYYQMINEANSVKAGEAATGCQDYNRPGTGQIRITNVEILDNQRKVVNKIEALQEMTIAIEFMAFEPVHGPRFSICVYSGSNIIITSISSTGFTEKITFHGKHRLEFRIPKTQLMSDVYSLEIKVGRNVLLDLLRHAASFRLVLTDRDAINLSSNQGIFITEGTWKVR